MANILSKLETECFMKEFQTYHSYHISLEAWIVSRTSEKWSSCVSSAKHYNIDKMINNSKSTVWISNSIDLKTDPYGTPEIFGTAWLTQMNNLYKIGWILLISKP